MADHDAAIERIKAEISKYGDRLKDLQGLMKKIGALGLSASQKAFRESRLGDIEWPVRYPQQAEPFINIAGAVSDWNAGRSAPKPSRFDREPPLVDEGQRGGLWGSLSWESGQEFARWGTNKEYARPHQEGGVTEQTVTPEAKKRMYEYFYGKKGARRKIPVGVRIKLQTPVVEVSFEHKRDKHGNMRTVRVETIQKTEFIPSGYIGEGEEAVPAGRADYIKKFGWLLNPATRGQSSILTTRVHRRPFVGVTDELEADVKEAIRRHVEGGR